MNWKLVASAFLLTALFAIAVVSACLIVLYCPLWVNFTIAFISGFFCVYACMKKRSEMEDPNDRLSWNNDYEEEDEL